MVAIIIEWAHDFRIFKTREEIVFSYEVEQKRIKWYLIDCLICKIGFSAAGNHWFSSYCFWIKVIAIEKKPTNCVELKNENIYINIHEFGWSSGFK